MGQNNQSEFYVWIVQTLRPLLFLPFDFNSSSSRSALIAHRIHEVVKSKFETLVVTVNAAGVAPPELELIFKNLKNLEFLERYLKNISIELKYNLLWKLEKYWKFWLCCIEHTINSKSRFENPDL